MLTVGIARVGNEPAVRFTTDNKAVLDLSLAFSYGRKGDDGKQPTQWVNGSLWGNRAEKLAPYIKKGQQIYVQLSDLHLETYQAKDGKQGASLKGIVQDVTLIGSRDAQQPEVHTQFERAPQQNAKSGFEDLDSDIPF